MNIYKWKFKLVDLPNRYCVSCEYINVMASYIHTNRINSYESTDQGLTEIRWIDIVSLAPAWKIWSVGTPRNSRSSRANTARHHKIGLCPIGYAYSVCVGKGAGRGATRTNVHHWLWNNCRSSCPIQNRSTPCRLPVNWSLWTYRFVVIIFKETYLPIDQV